MKYLTLIILLLLALVVSRQTEEDKLEEEEMEQQMVRYKFLLKLIQQFDNTGQGSVKKEDYAEFLAKVFIEGNRQQGYEIPDVEYLRRATLAFAESKSQLEIGVQDFYEDLLSKFYLFLSEKEEFQDLISVLFEGTEKAGESSGEEHQTQQL